MSPSEEPLVSVVIPVFNGEAYLRECLDSVLSQTYANWECVVVDNCSTDRTLEIAREYAARDTRLRIHANEAFVRVVPNHNNAFRQISPASRYTKLLGADDWLFPDCLEKLVSLCEAHPSVGVAQSYRLQGNKVAGDGLPSLSPVMSGRDASRLWLLPHPPSMLGAPSTLLYRSDIVRAHDPFWNESSIHADTESCLDVLREHDYGFVHQVLVYYRMRGESMTSFSTDNMTYVPARLANIVTYGPDVLTRAELDRATRDQLDSYYRSLGGQVFRRRGPEFWRLHRDRLASLGFPLSNRRLALGAMGYLVSLVLDPRQTVDRGVDRLRRRVRRPARAG